MSGEKVELVRRFIDAVNRRDRETFGALLHPEVEWHTFVGPVLGFPGFFRGRDEILRVTFEQIPEVLEDWHIVPLEAEELPGGECCPLPVTKPEAPPAEPRPRWDLPPSTASTPD
jgi:hypothetical protein